MAIFLVGAVSAGSTNGNTVTTGSMDTTGADFLVAVLADSTNGGGISDSKSNSWSSVTGRSTGNGAVQIFYSVPSSVGSGHTVSAAPGTGHAPSVFFLAFKGVKQSSPFDQQNGATSAGSTNLSSGSITPTQNEALIILGYASSSGAGAVLNADFPYATMPAVTLVAGQHYTGDAACQIQTTAAAISGSIPTTSSANCAVSIASFLPAAASGGGGGGAWAYA